MTIYNAPSYSDSPRNPNRYLGQDYRFTPCYIRKRNPVNGTGPNTLGDIKPKENQGRYPIGSIWINTASPVEIWILSCITADGAQWVLLANSLIQGPLLSLTDDSGLLVIPTDDVANPPGNIQFKAGSGITVTRTGTSEITITNTGSSQSFAPDTGTNPVTGAIINFSNTSILATGTLANALRSNGTAADTISYQTQYAGSNASSASATKYGVSQFDSNQFSVTNGFVTLLNGNYTGTATTVGAVTADINVNIPIPNNSATNIRVNLAGYTSSNLAVGGEVIGLARNVAGTVSVIPAPDLTKNNDPTMAAWSATLIASGTNVVVRVTGVAGVTINWRAFIDIVSAP